jgi:hypothetical protein
VAFHQFGETVKFPRNEHVDIHVREVTLNAEAPSGAVDCIEIREFIKEGEVYGHGIVLPASSVKDLQIALQRLTAPEKKDWARD